MIYGVVSYMATFSLGFALATTIATARIETVVCVGEKGIQNGFPEKRPW